MADLSYPFRWAAWKTARFISNPDTDKFNRNFNIQAGTVVVATVAGILAIPGTAPDSTVIDGQDERISAYEQKIDALDDFYDNNVQDAREAWRLSTPENQDAAETAMNQTHIAFQERAIDLLSQMYTENGISETEMSDLFTQFENDVGEISSFKFNDLSFADIEDASHLHEAQQEHSYSPNEHERAVAISEDAAKGERSDVKIKAMSPLFGLMGGMLYFLLAMLLDSAGFYKAIEKTSKKPAPQRDRKTGFNH